MHSHCLALVRKLNGCPDTGIIHCLGTVSKKRKSMAFSIEIGWVGPRWPRSLLKKTQELSQAYASLCKIELFNFTPF